MTKPKRMSPIRTTLPDTSAFLPRKTSRSPHPDTPVPANTLGVGHFGKPIRWWVRCRHGSVADLCGGCALWSASW